jgi:predicted DNA-binding transcriptional regulator YafY
MADRSSDAERASREAAALQLLSDGKGSAYTAALLAERYGVSLRQARRYVAAASFDLCDPATPAELDRQGMLSLHRLDLIAGRAMESGSPEDLALAIRATRAHASALAQLRRSIEPGRQTRFRLPTRSRPPDDPSDADPLPF